MIVIDGSMSSLADGWETNAGLTYKLVSECVPNASISLRYEPGIQWASWRSARDVIEGRGINRQIRRVYGFLASRYRPGDRIYLLGYSRGAYAVRSLAGVIERVGLLKPQHATVRNIRNAYRHYQMGGGGEAAHEFEAAYCHTDVEIEMLGCWDTVKALGLRLPLLWMLTEHKHKFHNHALGSHIRNAFHALARDETREAYAPVLWDDTNNFPGTVEQVWFPGTHGDVGGQLGGYEPARPLANVSLVWMLERLERCGIDLPEGWRERFPADPHAPSVGTWRGWGKLFLLRKKRVVGADVSEEVFERVEV